MGAQDEVTLGPWYIYESETTTIPQGGWTSWDLDDHLPRQASYWLKTAINNNTDEEVEKILYLSSLQEVDAYHGGESLGLITGTTERQSEVAAKGGRIIAGIGYSAQVPLLLRPGENEIALSVSNPIYETAILEPELYDRDTWYDQTAEQRSFIFMVQGLFTGALVMISLYHLLIYFIRRDSPFFWYAVYTAMMAAVMMFESGVILAMLGDFNQFVLRLIWETQILAFASSLLYFIFMRSFLDLKHTMPRLDKWIIRGLTVYVPIALFLDLYYIITLEYLPYSAVMPIIMLTSGLICVIIIFRTGSKLAIYFSVGSLLLYSGAMTNTLLSLFINLGWISEPAFPRVWFTELGVLLEILVFSLGLGYRLRLMDQEKELAVTRLRTKISSDLHDDVGSMLTGLSMQSNVMSYTAEGPIKEKLKQISEISRNALETMRDTVWAIDARQDNYTSLIDKVRDFAETNIPEDRMTYEVIASGIDRDVSLAPDIRQQLYLIYKEAFANALKHSDGTHVEIQFLKQKNHLYMKIQDNGSPTEKKDGPGLGLSNMRMRAEQINGQLEVSHEEGWSVILKVPL